MTLLLRHLGAVIALPITVTVLVPVWIARAAAVNATAPSNLADGLLAIPGLGLLVAGLVLFSACLMRFVNEGRGTLAPWDSTRHLIVRGPYRFVRNPMISAVVCALFGESLVLRSVPHAIWAGVFAAMNLLYIPLVEEADLEARFGDDYRRYKHRVPCFLPRLHR